MDEVLATLNRDYTRLLSTCLYFSLLVCACLVRCVLLVCFVFYGVSAL